jgi:hypothetical protein
MGLTTDFKEIFKIILQDLDEFTKNNLDREIEFCQNLLSQI